MKVRNLVLGIFYDRLSSLVNVVGWIMYRALFSVFSTEWKKSRGSKRMTSEHGMRKCEANLGKAGASRIRG